MASHMVPNVKSGELKNFSVRGWKVRVAPERSLGMVPSERQVGYLKVIALVSQALGRSRTNAKGVA